LLPQPPNNILPFLNDVVWGVRARNWAFFFSSAENEFVKMMIFVIVIKDFLPIKRKIKTLFDYCPAVDSCCIFVERLLVCNILI
jgi:hypothetical protein